MSVFVDNYQKLARKACSDLGICYPICLYNNRV